MHQWKFLYEIRIRSGPFREVILLSKFCCERNATGNEKSGEINPTPRTRLKTRHTMRHSCTAYTHEHNTHWKTGHNDYNGVRRCKHIMPALCQLHWLPVCRRLNFKISTLVYRSLASTAPAYRYLAEQCTLVTAAGRRPVQSADNRTCLVKRSCNQFGDRCFATAGPTL